MEFSGLNNVTELEKLIIDAVDITYLNNSPLKRLYGDLAHTLSVIQTILNAPNLCERCLLRVKDTWHCDAASCEIMHRCSCTNYVALG